MDFSQNCTAGYLPKRNLGPGHSDNHDFKTASLQAGPKDLTSWNESLCNPFSHCIRAGLHDQHIKVEVMLCSFGDCSHKDLWASICLSFQITHSRRSQLPCHKDDMVRIWGLLPHEWAILDMDPLTTIKPSDDCSPNWQLKLDCKRWETLSQNQLSCSRIPDPLKPYKIITVCFKQLCFEVICYSVYIANTSCSLSPTGGLRTRHLYKWGCLTSLEPLSALPEHSAHSWTHSVAIKEQPHIVITSSR